MPRTGKAKHRSFGTVRKLPSGRFQARYMGPDGQRYSAQRADGGGLTFETRGDADAWLTLRHSEMLKNEWMPPVTVKPSVLLFGTYAAAWLVDRDLAVRTRELYGRLLANHILPTFETAPLTAITSTEVRAWHAGLASRTGPTARSHAYSLLRTILNTAVADDLIAANPCKVTGAGQAKRVKQIRPATLPELEAIVTAMPDKYRALVLLAAWCAMRFGELTELRRGDVDLTNRAIRVGRGVVNTSGGRLVKDPKSEAGKRTVAIPPHLMPMVETHLKDHAAPGKDGLLFPSRSGGHLSEATLRKSWYPARAKADRSDLRFHDLRHTGAVLAAQTGATLVDLMARLGHSTPGAAMRYQHASQDRDRVIADALSTLVTGNVVPIESAKSARKSDAG